MSNETQSPRAGDGNLPPPAGMKWRRKNTDSVGAYFEDPRKFGINMDHPEYEWTPLYTAEQMRAYALAAAPAVPAPQTVEGGKWDGAEEWMPLAWELCANESGEDSCETLIWEGGPIPQPWGERWLKYEDQAKGMIAMVRKHVPAAAAPAAAPAAVPMCSEQAVLHALTMARGETHQQGDAALCQAFGRAMWRQFNSMLGAPAWQPIKTAPLDEIVLLLPSKHSRRPSVGRWRDFDVFNHPKFTHWMRIPAAPELQAPATVAAAEGSQP